MKDKKHNGIISFWKFAFCMLIVMFHLGEFVSNETGKVLFIKGAIGVEFFFLVSGYLMCKKALNIKEDTKKLGSETIKFIWKKVKVFFPYVVVGFIIGVIVNSIYEDLTLKDYILSIWDLLLLRMTGLKTYAMNGVTWYISSMLLCMIIIYPLIRKYKKNYLYIVAPLLVLLIAGWLNHTYGSLRDPYKWIGFTYKGTIRAFIELNLGAILYPLSEKLKKVNFNNLGRFLLTIVEIVGLIIPFVTSHFIEKATRYDYIVLAIMALSICIIFSEKTLELNFCNNNFFYHLEKLSLSLFIIHNPIRFFFAYTNIFDSWTYYQQFLLYLPLCIIVAEITMFIIEKLRKKEFFIPKLKKLIIN